MKLSYPINHSLLALDQRLTFKTLRSIAAAKAGMFHARKVSEEEWDAQLWNNAASILLELNCVGRIVFGGENLHRDGNFIDVLLRQKRWVANGDAVD